MFPRRDGWIPKFRKGTYSKPQPKRSSFRPVKPCNRSFSANENQYIRKRQKPHVLAGMFANAKSSVPVTTASYDHIPFGRHSVVSQDYLESPQNVSKCSNFPRTDLTSSWDFSDVSVRSGKIAGIPSPTRLNSDEEHPRVEEFSIPIATLKKPRVPWLRKCDSSDEISKNLKPKKAEFVEYPDDFEETIDSFSSRLDQIGALPCLPLQNHTDTTMGKVEKTLISVALTQTKDKECRKSLPLYDLLVERSDWLIFQEEFNDDTDYLPKDPFYTHDVVSSDFEEYMQEKEAANEPSYSKMMSSASQVKVDNASQESQNDLFGLLKESHDDLDSQEDFFNINFPSTSQREPQVHARKEDHFPMFEKFCSSSTPADRLERKRRTTTDNFTPRPSTKRHPVPQLSSEYSPFNFDLLSSSSPSSPEKSRPSSNYSIW